MRPHGRVMFRHHPLDLRHLFLGPWAPSFQVGQQQLGSALQGETDGKSSFVAVRNKAISYHLVISDVFCITEEGQRIRIHLIGSNQFPITERTLENFAAKVGHQHLSGI